MKFDVSTSDRRAIMDILESRQTGRIEASSKSRNMPFDDSKDESIGNITNTMGGRSPSINEASSCPSSSDSAVTLIAPILSSEFNCAAIKTLDPNSSSTQNHGMEQEVGQVSDIPLPTNAEIKDYKQEELLVESETGQIEYRTLAWW